MSGIDADVDTILETLLQEAPKPPKSINISFEDANIKDVFEFLLELTTNIFKFLYGDENGIVNLGLLQLQQFSTVEAYIQSIGFKVYFEKLNASADILNFLYNNRYDRIQITSTTRLNELMFAIKCDNVVYKISFDMF